MFILKPKLRERKETNNSQCVIARKTKARKHDHSWASAEIFPGGEGQHIVYHLQIADNQCSCCVFPWQSFKTQSTLYKIQ